NPLCGIFSTAACGTTKFFDTTSRGVCAIQSESSTVSYSEKLPSSNTSRNSPPSGASPWIECGIPGGKYHKSPSLVSPTKLFPSASMQVMRVVPYSMYAHSAAVCQCNSRTPPAVSRMFTPASDFETASSRTVTSRDHPPSWTLLCAIEKGYLNVGTPPASVGGGFTESAFYASRAGFFCTGSLRLGSPCVF